MKRIVCLLFSLLCIVSTIVSAQEIDSSIKIGVKLESEEMLSGNEYCKVVCDNQNVYHIYGTTKATYKFEPTFIPDGYKFKSASYSLCGDIMDSGSIIPDAEGQYFLEKNFNKSGEYIIEDVVFLYVNDKEELTIRNNENLVVKVWDTPICDKPSISTIALFSNDVYTLTVSSPSGGYSDDWRYRWNKSNSFVKENSYEYHAVDVKSVRTEKVSVDIYNYAPDGVTVWYETSYEYNVTVYPKPTLFLETYNKEKLIESIEDSSKKIDLVVGETLTIKMVSNGGDDNKWSYSWLLDEVKDSDLQIYEFTAERAGSFVIKAKVINSPEGIVSSFEAEQVINITVIDKPTVNFPINGVEYFAGGIERSLYVEVSGYSGYKYSWVVDNEELGTNNTFKYSFLNDTEKVLEKDANVSVKYKKYTQDELETIGSLYFQIKVYPNIKMEVEWNEYPKDVYIGDKQRMNVIAMGGNANAWEYEWTINGMAVENNTSIYEFVGTRGNEINVNDDASYTVKVKVCNRDENKTELFKQEYEHIYKVWSEPIFNSAEFVKNVTYSGNKVQLDLETQGGKRDGWSFEIYCKETNKIVSTKEKSFDIEVFNYEVDKDSVVYNYEVKWFNKCTEDNKREGVFSDITITVWPEPQMPKVINIADNIINNNNSIREGNKTIFMVNPAYGGYKGGWTYKWVIDNTAVADGTVQCAYTAKLKNSSQGKQKETQNIKLYIENKYKNESWAKDTLDVNIHIYNKPLTPKGLKEKGNGNSCMFIAMSDLNDDKLQSLEYQFVYGYTDANGIDHLSESVSTRYYQYTSAIYKNPALKFWVATQWQYDDALVTSGRIFLNADSADEDFDASVYGTTTRATAGLISSTSANEVCFNGHSFIVDLPMPLPAFVYIYNMKASMIKFIEYPAQAHYNEVLDMTDLAQGIYIVKICVGDMSIVKKVVVE